VPAFEVDVDTKLQVAKQLGTSAIALDRAFTNDFALAKEREQRLAFLSSGLFRGAPELLRKVQTLTGPEAEKLRMSLQNEVDNLGPKSETRTKLKESFANVTKELGKQEENLAEAQKKKDHAKKTDSDKQWQNEIDNFEKLVEQAKEKQAEVTAELDAAEGRYAAVESLLNELAKLAEAEEKIETVLRAAVPDEVVVEEKKTKAAEDDEESYSPSEVDEPSCCAKYWMVWLVLGLLAAGALIVILVNKTKRKADAVEKDEDDLEAPADDAEERGSLMQEAPADSAEQ